MEHANLSGGCLCDSVRYRTPLPKLAPTLCHCVSCRKAAGAHAVGFYTVNRNQVVFEAEKPREYRSSLKVVRGFCGRCGSALTYWHSDRPDDLSITIATLDRPGRVSPADHTWMSDAVAWDSPFDGLRHFQRDRRKATSEEKQSG